MTTSLQSALEAIETSVADENVRDATSIPIGKGFRQGDIYAIRVKTTTKRGDKMSTKQLVKGNTKGSRHIVEGATLFELDEIPSVLGSVDNSLHAALIVCGKDGGVLTHPEHADVEMAPKSCWVTWRQMDARTRRAVQD